MNTSNLPLPVELIPHEPPMVFVDRILEFNSSSIRTEFTIKPDNLFYVQCQGLPAYTTFEMMAQSIAAHDGMLLKMQNKPPEIGLLLGSRKFQVSRDWLQTGEKIEITATSQLSEGNMRSFLCTAKSDDETQIASGSISVFKPDDQATFKSSLVGNNAD